MNDRMAMKSEHQDDNSAELAERERLTEALRVIARCPVPDRYGVAVLLAEKALQGEDIR